MDSLTPREERDVIFSEPPPVRRIVVDREPTVVSPPATNGHNAPLAPGAVGFSSPLRRPEPSPGPKIERMRTESVRISYGEKVAVEDVTLPVRQGEVLALIGPSGCGKTTLLRSLNRLVEITPTAVRGGRITLDGEDIDRMEVTALRKRVSMVFQQPNPFPMSVFDNVAYALREQGSSSSSTSGRAASARAMQSRCCWPPERRSAGWSSVAPTSSQSPARTSASPTWLIRASLPGRPEPCSRSA